MVQATISNKDRKGDLDIEATESLIPASSGAKDNAEIRNRSVTNTLHLDKKHKNAVCKDVPKGLQNIYIQLANLRRMWKRIVCVIIIIILALQLFTALSIWRDRQRVFQSIQKDDYAHVNNITDLSTKSSLITDRCYPGMKKKCFCEDPIEESSREGQRHWSKATNENMDRAKDIKSIVDVVFIGDSITEGWKGTSYGFEVGRKRDNIAEYESLFTLDGGGKYEGLVLGISGDTSANLLWRMNHGELPNALNPSVFWILIGTNDIGNNWCSPEVTLIGILRVVEELRAKKPGSTIVINGLLPRSFDKKHGFLMRKKTPGIETKSNPPALWHDIVVINEELKAYSAQHEGVEYFDASDIFLVDKSVSTKKLKIDASLMGDYLHPSAKGYRKWGERIVERLDLLI